MLLEASEEEAAVAKATASIVNNRATCPRIALNPSEREVSEVVAVVVSPETTVATWVEVPDLTSIEASSRVRLVGVLFSRAHQNLKLHCGVLHLILL